nr:transmembrane and coiled-coil domain-containing protein 6 isoform X2 [Pogona vitticeps]
MLSLQSDPVSGAATVAASAGIPCARDWKRSRYRSCNAEDLRAWRRERESALRSARRLQQLTSKRLLHEDTLTEEEQVRNDAETAALFSEEEILQLLKKVQKGTEERVTSLRLLRRALRLRDNQQTFIRLEGSMRVLIGLFTSNLPDLQMDAAHCLHELSHSSDPDVAAACLPATSYLLTYLSGHSIALISPYVVVQEGVGYVLSQLLQSREAQTEIVPLILDSTLPQDMLHLVCSNIEEGIGAAVECAWGLHYIICSQVNNSLLISQRIVPSLVQLLVELASMLSTTSTEGLELLLCPVVRCVANLLAEDGAVVGQLVADEECLLRVLFVFIQYFFVKHLFIVQECLWLINNLTADSTTSCCALLNLDLFPPLLQLLSSHHMVNLLVLTVLCNTAAKGAVYCQTLYKKAVLLPLIGILALSDTEVVGQILELLHLLFLHCPEAAIDFVAQAGPQALQQHLNNLQLQERVKALIQTVSELGAPSLN